MEPKTPLEIRADIHASGLSSSVSPMIAAVEAYKDLRDRDDPRTAEEDALYFEVCLVIARYDFAGLGGESTANMLALVAANGVDHYRPASAPETLPLE